MKTLEEMFMILSLIYNESESLMYNLEHIY